MEMLGIKYSPSNDFYRTDQKDDTYMYSYTF